MLALPAIAAAGPKPIKKPDNPPAGTSTPPAKKTTPPASTGSSSSSGSTVTPVTHTPVGKPTGTTTGTTSGASSGTAKTGSSGTGSTAKTPAKPQIVNGVGRDQSGAEAPVQTLPTEPKIVAPAPTPLGTVSVRDRAVHVRSEPTPAWKLALLALLAAAEAFLVVRLVRHRPGQLSPAS